MSKASILKGCIIAMLILAPLAVAHLAYRTYEFYLLSEEINQIILEHEKRLKENRILIEQSLKTHKEFKPKMDAKLKEIKCLLDEYKEASKHKEEYGN